MPQRTNAETFSVTALIATVALTAPTVVCAEILIEETTTYYRVSGNSTDEIRYSINNVRNNNGKPFDATTHWSIGWQFNFATRANVCTITTINIDVKIEYELPRWDDAKRHRDKDLVHAWNSYYEKLLQHEMDHGTIAKSTASKVENAIRDSVSETMTCGQLELLANKNANHVVDLSRQQHRDFDNSTNHGASTGAVFP